MSNEISRRAAVFTGATGFLGTALVTCAPALFDDVRAVTSGRSASTGNAVPIDLAQRLCGLRIRSVSSALNPPSLSTRQGWSTTARTAVVRMRLWRAKSQCGSAIPVCALPYSLALYRYIRIFRGSAWIHHCSRLLYMGLENLKRSGNGQTYWGKRIPVLCA